MTIDEEIQQSTWESPQQKAVVNALLTSRVLEGVTAHFLEGFDLTSAQFNVLRIVRGQKGKPASIKLIVERMLDKSSNASRIVDRLLEKGLVDRVVCPKDRRAVEVSLTESGRTLLGRIDKSGHAWSRIAEALPDTEAKRLSELLDRLRAAVRALEARSRDDDRTRQGENP